MSDNPFQETYRSYEGDYDYDMDRRPRHHIVRTAFVWAAIAVAAVLLMGTVIWAFGLIFQLAVLLLKIALVTAVVALVWRRVTRRPRRGCDV